jgi:hypothetical protein
LAPTQLIAAFWAISWPALLATLLVGLVGVIVVSRPATPNTTLIWSVGQILFFAVQAYFTRRLVRKEFRTFRIYVIREDGSRGRSLSVREVLSVWLWIFVPQFLFLVAIALPLQGFGSKLSAETVRSISQLSQWVRVLLIGPIGIFWALHSQYSGFQLRAQRTRGI